jgi:hypothetical protein
MKVKLATLGRSRVVFEELLEEASREALDQERLHTVRDQMLNKRSEELDDRLKD